MGCALSIDSRVQRELRAFDPRLRIVWNHHADLFEIQQLSKLGTGRFETVLFWAATDQSGRFYFRHLPGTAEPIIRRLQRMHTKSVAGDTPEKRDLFYRKHLPDPKADRHAAAQEWGKMYASFAPDEMERSYGIRQTFGPGPLPTRRRKRMSGGFKKAIAAKEKRQK